ncbi:MAG: 50S ribosomal protein L20 [Candidatus Taylorbacteria bacterium]|nr:50S ribosomal protein L20 [Candidatus Taylorbacteria bacterium]
MTRVKKALNALKYRRNLLRAVKGYRFGRSKKERQAQEAFFHAGAHAFAHRRDKKNDFRRLWSVRLGAALRQNGLSYSRFIGLAKKRGVSLNRKILSNLADNHPETFKKVLTKITG